MRQRFFLGAGADQKTTTRMIRRREIEHGGVVTLVEQPTATASVDSFSTAISVTKEPAASAGISASGG